MGCFNSKPATLSEANPTASEQPVISRDAKPRVVSENDATTVFSPDSTPRQLDESLPLPTSTVEITEQVEPSHQHTEEHITNPPVQYPEDPEPPSCDVPSAEDCIRVDIPVPSTTAVAIDDTTSENDATIVFSPDSTRRQLDESLPLPTSTVEITEQVEPSHQHTEEHITNPSVQYPEGPEPPSCDVPSAEDCIQVDIPVPSTTAVAIDATDEKAENLDQHDVSNVDAAEKAKEESSLDAVEDVVMTDAFVMVEQDAGGASSLTGASATIPSLVDTSIPEAGDTSFPEAGDTQHITRPIETHSSKSCESERSTTDQMQSSPSSCTEPAMENSSSKGNAPLSPTASSQTGDKQDILPTIEHHSDTSTIDQMPSSAGTVAPSATQQSSTKGTAPLSSTTSSQTGDKQDILPTDEHYSEKPFERDSTDDQMPSSPSPVALLATQQSSGSETVLLSSTNSADLSAVDPDNADSREETLDVVRDTTPSVKKEPIFPASKIVEDSTETLKEDEKSISFTFENVGSSIMKSAILEDSPFKPSSGFARGPFATSSNIDKASRQQQNNLTWDYRSPYRGGCDEFVLNNPPHGIGFYTFTNSHGNVGTNLEGGAYHYQNIGTDGGFYIKNRDGSSYHYSPYRGGTYSDGYGY